MGNRVGTTNLTIESILLTFGGNGGHSECTKWNRVRLTYFGVYQTDLCTFGVHERESWMFGLY